MSEQPHGKAEVLTPALPKGGGALQSIGTGWGAVGMTGEASFNVPLPISPGRGDTPSLALGYNSALGNGPFGIGWTASPGAISRNALKGVPSYTDEDEFIGPTGVELIPERTAQGIFNMTVVTDYNGLQLEDSYTVLRYLPRVESSFDRIEHWSSRHDTAGFWLLQRADGSVHLFGKTLSARCADPDSPTHVAQWLLEESLTPLGEHIYYQYKRETQRAEPEHSIRDFRAQRYLSRVCYGNIKACAHLFLWTVDTPADKQWHFELVFDYGERTTALTQVPPYVAQRAWLEREDPFFNYAYGFELGNRRLCWQVLMFHYFPEEPSMGPEPVLTRRLLLEYTTTELGGNLLSALHNQAFDAGGSISYWPPLELSYSAFTQTADPARYETFEGLQGGGGGQSYQLVDLYNDGLPGVLYPSDKNWHYREPLRAQPPAGANAVTYGPLQALPRIPIADRTKPARQSLMDLNGDGRLEWIIAQPGMSGFFTLDHRRRWSSFVPVVALPQEFFHPQSQLADLMGNGIYDLAMIGPQSVRLYVNQGVDGFSPANEVPHEQPTDALPLPSASSTELVAFSDILGSGQQHLVRIRHNEVKCWPNLGRGRFGKGFVFAQLPFAHNHFEASRVLLTDLDGSGAADLLYLEPDRALIFMNLLGNGYSNTPTRLSWPDGVRHDRFCQVSTADLQGVGCSSLILTVNHGTSRHWRYDFVKEKPYLLIATNNNTGAEASLTYRSSAQEWLDEKQQRQYDSRPQITGLPFPMHLVSKQQQKDLISGNQLTQSFRYRDGFYDGVERKFQGFGLLLETDTEITGSDESADSHIEPLLRKSWFHTGKVLDMSRHDYHALDATAHPLGYTLLSQPDQDASRDAVIPFPSSKLASEMAYALSGMPLREEIYAANDPPLTAIPYSISQQRYLVRQVHAQAALLPMLLESISYRYEREADDPGCQHTINLQWDSYGSLIHGVTIHYARRKQADNAPPFSDTYQKQWWVDTHDPAQQQYYLTETRAQFIHLDNPQRWRLQLPYRQRTNALVLQKTALGPDRISYEHFIADTPDAPLGTQAKRTLGSLSVQYYCEAQSIALPAGQASFQALVDHVETAELDEPALKAYDSVQNLQGAAPFDLSAALAQAHYHPMALFLPQAPTQAPLWSVKTGFTRYGAAQCFYRPDRLRATESHGFTTVEHDRYYCHTRAVTTPDGCVTQALHDYRVGLPVQITDPQGNRQQARYDAFGQLQATSFYGQEAGKAVGFAPISDYRRPADDSPDAAIKDPKNALLNVASAHFYAPFSWMGHIPPSTARAQWIAQGFLLPSGHIRAAAYSLLATLDMSKPGNQQLSEQIKEARREPVHTVVLQADRYPSSTDDAEPLIRISLTCSDGFGRVLQTKQKAPSGLAYKVDDSGALSLDSTDKPVSVTSHNRWRVSGRIEYNNKGLAIRNYRPYFADRHHYINDQSLRKSGYSDRLFYDALGRPTRTINASGDMSQHTYCTWYTIYEDENDTHGYESDMPVS